MTSAWAEALETLVTLQRGILEMLEREHKRELDSQKRLEELEQVEVVEPCQGIPKRTL